ncbi:MAG: DUF302 domain-containing protein [Candidatus Ancaeobacter aquaticus]|nr:DUF302 domain-containing protein [Candidatus Ancaeobacter aquaticus]
MKKVIIGLVFGFVIGIAVCVGASVVLVPKYVLLVKESKYTIDETIKHLAKAIEKEKWHVLVESDVNESLSRAGVKLKPKIKIIKFSKAEYAKEILEDHRELACMMPPSIAVYEGEDGKVYISKMNMGLIAKIYGGVVNKIMGEKISVDENRIISAVVKREECNVICGKVGHENK